MSSQPARITLRSQALTNQSDLNTVREAIISDLQTLAEAINLRQVLPHNGSDRLVIPTAGVAKIYCTSAATTVGSDGSNYFTIKVLRNGQDETGLTRDSRHDEIQGYSEFYLGISNVGKGDILSLQVVMTGGPIYPILTSANVSMRVELGPQATIR